MQSLLFSEIPRMTRANNTISGPKHQRTFLNAIFRCSLYAESKKSGLRRPSRVSHNFGSRWGDYVR